MEKKSSGNKLVLYNTLSTVLLYAITFFSAPIFSRLLGTEEYGVVQVYNTWQSFFTVILGLYTRGTLSIAKVNYNDEEFKEYQSSALFLSLTGFAVSFIILMVFHSIIISFFGMGLEYLIIMLVHSFGVYCVYFVNTKFTYEMKAHNNLLISVSLALVNFALSYLLIKVLRAEHLYTGRILGMAVPYVVAGIVIIFFVFRQGKVLYSRKYWKFCLPLCLPLVFHGISGIVCASSDRVMLQKMVNLNAVGIYALAYNFANIMDSIWGALHNSWDPFFFEFVKQGQLNELERRSVNYIRLFSCLCMGFILLTPEVYHIFASVEYWDGTKVIPIIVLSSYFIFIYAFAANFEFCYKRTDIIAIGSVIAGVTNIFLNYFLIIWLDFMGAAIATLLSNVLLAVVHIVFARNLVKDKWVYTLKMFIPAASGIMFAMILFYICQEIWIVRWIAAFCIGGYMVMKIFKNRAIF